MVWKGNFPRGFHLAKNLAQLGHRTAVLTTAASEVFKTKAYATDGVEIIETPDLFRGKARSGWDFWNVNKRINWLKKRNFDIIHGCDSRPVVIYPALYARRRNGGKFVSDWGDWWGRGGTIDERNNRALKLLFGRIETYYEEHFRTWADGVAVMTAALRKRALGLGVPPEKLHLFRHGADVDGISSYPLEEARQLAGLPTRQKVVGYLGAANPGDQVLLVGCFRELLQRRSDCRLLLLGGNMPIAQAYLKRCGVEDRVISPGWLPYEQLGVFLSGCDVLLLPLGDTISNRGRFPSKICDYLCAGRPIVVTGVGDVAGIINNNKAGLVSEPQPADFAAKVVEFLEDPGYADSLGANGRRAAEGKFSWKLVAEEMMAFYKRLMA